jgi:HAD superfamily hydrolase (TIGR01509 family)
MIKGVIFDMDGVLIDSEVVYRNHLHEFLKNSEVHVEISELNFLAGSSSKVELEYLSKKLNTTIEEADRIRTSYFNGITIKYKEIKKPYVNELLEYLRSNRIKIGLASSSSMENIQSVLDQCQIKDYFSIIVSGEMFKETKPNPEIYNYTVNSMNIDKEEILVIEDSNYGIEAAKAAHLKVAALMDSTFGFDLELADYKMESLKDVIKIIKTYER